MDNVIKINFTDQFEIMDYEPEYLNDTDLLTNYAQFLGRLSNNLTQQARELAAMQRVVLNMLEEDNENI